MCENPYSVTAQQYWRFHNGIWSWPKERYFYDIQFLFQYLNGVNSLFDFGCGEGTHLELLSNLTNLKLFACDLDSPLFTKARLKLKNKVNFVELNERPIVDMTTSFSVILYMFDDQEVLDYLKTLNASILILRVPCNSTRLQINKFSDELSARYAAIYRSVAEVESLISQSWKLENVSRAFPDELESKYGTQQYYFVGKR